MREGFNQMRYFITFLLIVNLSVFIHAVEKVNVKTVISGDEFYATYKGKEKKIQFLDVDAPEMKQAYGREAKAYLEKNIKGKTVTLKNVEESVLTIYAEIYSSDGTDLSVEILKSGNGWFNENKSLRKDLSKHQSEARQKKLGLWGEANTPVAPWLYRKNPSKYPHAEATQEYEERKKAAEVKSQQNKVKNQGQPNKQIISPAEATKMKEEKAAKEAASEKPKKILPRKKTEHLSSPSQNLHHLRR